MTANITHEQIAKRAYEIYLRNGAVPGRDEQNWLQAEAELRQELEQAAPLAAVPASMPAVAAAAASAVAAAARAVKPAPAKPAARRRKTGSRVKLS
jgi:hypothetical protein